MFFRVRTSLTERPGAPAPRAVRSAKYAPGRTWGHCGLSVLRVGCARVAGRSTNPHEAEHEGSGKRMVEWGHGCGEDRLRGGATRGVPAPARALPRRLRRSHQDRSRSDQLPTPHPVSYTHLRAHETD